MKIRNLFLVLATSAALTSCSVFDDDGIRDSYEISNDPLINRSEPESLPLDAELKKLVETNDCKRLTDKGISNKINVIFIMIKVIA